MFKKKPAVKPAAPLRSSDRRKLATGIISDFHLSPLKTLDSLPPTSTTPAPATDLPTEAESSTNANNANTNNTPEPALTALRATLLPDSTVAAKFTTTLGPDLHPVNGLIYSGVHSQSPLFADGKTRPLWVKTDTEGGMWFPSVYTCWEAVEYGLLPLVYTHAGVMEKVYGGADLMMPGVVGVRRKSSGDDKDDYGGVKKGEVVGVADYKSENVVLAVGVAEVDIAVDGGRGEKGKGVRILHWVNDELWSLGGAGVGPPEKLDVAWGANEAEEGGVSLEGLKIGEDVPEGSCKAVERPTEEDDDDEPQFPDLSTAEIDNAFRDALIFSLHSVLAAPDRASNANMALNFPLQSSYVLANLIIPKLPSPNPNYSIQKTSWKKIQKMLKQMDKEELLKIKERGGDVVVYAVNWDCNKLTSFTPYPIIVPRQRKKKAEDNGEGTSSSSSAPSAIKVVELYKALPKKLDAIYNASGTSSKSFYTASQLRETLYKYFASPDPKDPSETLVSATNARMVKINPILADLLLDDSRPADAKLLQVGQATRDLLAEKFVKAHQQYYRIISPSGEESKPRAGQPPKVVLTLESRQGKKTVTRVKGMEVFGVDVGKFMDELKAVAASSVTKAAVEGGGKAAEGMVEVMVQGDKSAEVERLLLKAGVRKMDLMVDNKLKKKK
ncbi:Ligatin [Dactylellina cionopaga]|nr:Ligatin [Dactylellina cionopaga]